MWCVAFAVHQLASLVCPPCSPSGELLAEKYDVAFPQREARFGAAWSTLCFMNSERPHCPHGRNTRAVVKSNWRFMTDSLPQSAWFHYVPLVTRIRNSSREKPLLPLRPCCPDQNHHVAHIAVLRRFFIHGLPPFLRFWCLWAREAAVPHGTDVNLSCLVTKLHWPQDTKQTTNRGPNHLYNYWHFMTPKSKCTLFLCSQRTELLPLKQGILQIPSCNLWFCRRKQWTMCHGYPGR